LLGNRGNRSDIGHLGHRVGRCLDKKQFGVRLNRIAPGIGRGQAHIGGFNTESGQDIVEQLHRCTEQALRGNDVIACREQAHGASQNRRHARGSGNAEFRAFQRSQALLKGAYGRIGETSVDIARLGAGKARSRLGRTAKHKAGGQIQGFAVLPKLGALNPAANGQRLVMPFRINRKTHAGLLSQKFMHKNKKPACNSQAGFDTFQRNATI
jgi:hypothetical protein